MKHPRPILENGVCRKPSLVVNKWCVRGVKMLRDCLLAGNLHQTNSLPDSCGHPLKGEACLHATARFEISGSSTVSLIRDRGRLVRETEMRRISLPKFEDGKHLAAVNCSARDPNTRWRRLRLDLSGKDTRP